MSSLKHAIVLALAILAFVLLAVSVLEGAGDKSDAARWENLQSVKPGSDVRVSLKNVETWQGKMRAVSDDGLAIQTSDGEKSFARDSVARVSAKSRSHRKRNVLIGLGVGAVTGVIVGVANPELGQGTCEQGSCTNAGTAAMVGVAAAAGGAAVGAIIPTGGWHEVFRAPPEAAARPGGTVAAPGAGGRDSSLTGDELARK